MLVTVDQERDSAFVVPSASIWKHVLNQSAEMPIVLLLTTTTRIRTVQFIFARAVLE
jgi:hypothetical protein